MNVEEMFSEIENCKSCEMREICEENDLQPAFPFGAIKNPLMLVFINPSPKNVTVHKNWRHDRLFFYGDIRFWRFLAEVNLFDKKLLKLVKKFGWLPEFIPSFKEELAKKDVWITNLVKCPTLHGEYPQKNVVEVCKKKFLEKEIEMLKPRLIIAFGQFTYKMLTGKALSLSMFFRNEVDVNEGILPCYFPTGRGNTEKATACIKRILSRL